MLLRKMACRRSNKIRHQQCRAHRQGQVRRGVKLIYTESPNPPHFLSLLRHVVYAYFVESDILYALGGLFHFIQAKACIVRGWINMNAPLKKSYRLQSVMPIRPESKASKVGSPSRNHLYDAGATILCACTACAKKIMRKGRHDFAFAKIFFPPRMFRCTNVPLQSRPLFSFLLHTCLAVRDHVHEHFQFTVFMFL